MGRPTNEKCWACSLLNVNEARKQHDGAIGESSEHEEEEGNSD